MSFPHQWLVVELEPESKLLNPVLSPSPYPPYLPHMEGWGALIRIFAAQVEGFEALCKVYLHPGISQQL